MTDPYTGYPGDGRDEQINECSLGFAGLYKSQGLETERGERGVAPTDANHDEQPLPRADKQPAVGARQRSIKSDDERAGHVDEQCAPGKTVAKLAHEQNGHQKTCHSADDASERDRNIRTGLVPE